MTKWINGEHLSQIIDGSIRHHEEKGLRVKVDFTKYEPFNGSTKHTNIIIGDIIDDIEKVLRFTFEKYFNNYHLMLVDLLGEENAGVNWAVFLEYGTRNSLMIALQNYGLSRHSSNYILQKHRNCLKVEGDKLIEIDIIKLKQSLNSEDVEFEEISSILF